ncbi:hypothetical protein HDU97_003921 [Phlyctochytrium planicorne]|nr:hypothetical protein HDU97_003921 [Phlyctochytrium planicorne]
MIMNRILAIVAGFLAVQNAVAVPAGQTPIPSPVGLETAAEINAICAKTSKNLWETHLCKAKGNVQDGCMPQRRFAYGNKNSIVKGVVLLFHGYTACPDAMEFLAAYLQKNGYQVYTPLNVGHGLKYGDCARPGAFCIDNTPIDQLPTTKQGYIEFVKWAVSMVRQEVNSIPVASRDPKFTVGVAGLSLGGPLAAVAAQLGNDIFKKVILVNPFFSAAVQTLDYQVQDCKAAADPAGCINSFVAAFTKVDKATSAGQPAPPGTVGVSTVLDWWKSKAQSLVTSAEQNVISYLLLNKYIEMMKILSDAMVTVDSSNLLSEKIGFLNTTYGWGAGCVANTARPGYCSFQVKNLVAISAFGAYALSRAPLTTSKQVSIITTERDGPVRSGIAFAAARGYAPGNTASLCMYLRGASCSNPQLISGDNICGVPHSCFSHAENVYTAPNSLYWEGDLFTNVLNTLAGNGMSVGTAGSSKLGQCSTVALNAPYSSRIYDATIIYNDAVSRWKA